MKKQYMTKQKAALIDFFKENKDKCFTSHEIIKNEYLNLGEATVYRLLNKISAEGIIKKYIQDETGGTMYQYNLTKDCNGHFHMKCLVCGKLLHTECKEIVSVINHIESEHAFSVDNSKTVFYGVCKECENEKN